MINLFKNFFDAMGTLPVGMIFVIAVLGVIYLVCALVGRAFTQPKKESTNTPVKSSGEPELIQSNAEDEIDENTLLVITAAVDRMLEGQAFRVISVKPLGYSSWVEQGRSDIFRSHHQL